MTFPKEGGWFFLCDTHVLLYDVKQKGVRHNMEEMLVESRDLTTEGQGMRCSYSVLVDTVPVGRFSCEQYGVKIEAERGETVSFPGLTFSAAEIDELMEKLIRHRVTPTGLADVLCDWKKRK